MSIRLFFLRPPPLPFHVPPPTLGCAREVRRTVDHVVRLLSHVWKEKPSSCGGVDGWMDEMRRRWEEDGNECTIHPTHREENGKNENKNENKQGRDIVSQLGVLLCNHDGSLWLSQFGEDTPTPGGFRVPWRDRRN